MINAPSSAPRNCANRANALLSTGPRTTARKPDAYRRQRCQFFDAYQPATATETQLTQELVDTAWRLNRIPALEAALLDRAANPPSGQAAIDFDIIDAYCALATLGLLGQRLSHQFQKTLESLREIQSDHASDRAVARDPAELTSGDGFVFSSDQIEAFSRAWCISMSRATSSMCFSICPCTPALLSLARPRGNVEWAITEVNLMKPTAGPSILSIVLIASLMSATVPGVFAQSTTKAPRNKREFVAKSHAEWTALNFTGPCGGASSPGGVISNACAEAAIEQTASECGGSARFFERSSRTWQVVNLVMILASAGFTAVGASATIANARLFSTLGGTTGLGAITTTINANSSADTAGLTAVNTTLANFLIFLKSGIVPGAITNGATDGTGATGPSNTAPDNATIYKFAPVFAAQCEAAATSSGK